MPMSRFVDNALHKAGLFRVPIAVCLAVASMAAGVRAGAAENWPARPVILMQTFAGGGMMDFVTRSIAQDLTTTLNQTFVAETRQGGGGIVGLISAAKSPPDGYTFVVTAIGPMVFRPMIEKDLGFDADKDFEPVILIGETPNGILVAPKLGVGTIKELVAYAKAHGNQLNIGHPGVGTMGQYCGVLLARMTGIEGNFIAYRGATPIINDLRGSQIDVGTPAYGPGATAVKILAVSGDRRLASLPDVPTLKESGVDMACGTWIAIFAPAHTPQPIIVKLNAAIDAYLRKPDTRDAFEKAGLSLLGGSPRQLTERMMADRKVWGPVVTEIAK